MNYSCLYEDVDQIKYMFPMVLAQFEFDLKIEPDDFIRVASYPLNFKAYWMTRHDKRVFHMHTVPPILEKEPLRLEDSRLMLFIELAVAVKVRQ